MKIFISTYFAVIIVMLNVQSVFSEQVEKRSNNDYLLFSYFIDNGEDGLHLCYSHDGLTWNNINSGKSLLKPEVGENNLMRDPCVIQSPDGVFHMVWTTSWEGKTIGYAHSKDLINWSKQKAIPVMKHEPNAMNSWAPELFYDEKNKSYIIFWSTTIPGRFPDTDDTGNKGRNHRIYATTTRDFETFTPTRLFFDPGFQCIDATIEKDGNRYIMFVKDEVFKPEYHRYIMMTSASEPMGPYGPLSEPITGESTEGPTAIKIGDYWCLYYDKYRESKFGLKRSRDLKQWEDLTPELKFPEGMHHGTVFRVSKDILQGLLEL